MRDCLIVLGMHRSGTSALAGALHQLGVSFGPDLLEPQDDNVRGYFENQRVLILHEKLLADVSSSWDDLSPRAWEGRAGGSKVAEFQRALEALLADLFSESTLCAIKDPRLCRLLPLWKPVLDNLGVIPRIVVACRNPREVASSLARRDGFSTEKSGLLWSDHMISAERHSRGQTRCFVSYADLLERPVTVLEQLGEQLDLAWPRSPGDLAERLRAFLDPALRHPPDADTTDAAAFGRAAELIDPLQAALEAALEDPSSTEAFDALAGKHARAFSDFDPLLLEHFHSLVRREGAISLWANQKSLDRDLRRASKRLGEGLAGVESALSKLSIEREEVAADLADTKSDLAKVKSRLNRLESLEADRASNIDGTLRHFQAAVSTTEEGMKHLQSELLEIENKLIAVERALAHARR